MHIISATDFPLFCSNVAQKCLILSAECSLKKSLILLEILPAEFIQAYPEEIKGVHKETKQRNILHISERELIYKAFTRTKRFGQRSPH